MNDNTNTNIPVNTNTPAAVPALTLRDKIRKDLIGNAPKGETRAITLFGVPLELHQPTLEAIMSAQEENNTAKRAATMIIRYCYVPGTNDPAFEAGDVDIIMNWPFGKDVLELNSAIADMTGVNIAEAEKELKENPLKERS